MPWKWRRLLESSRLEEWEDRPTELGLSLVGEQVRELSEIESFALPNCEAGPPSNSDLSPQPHK